MLDEDAYAAVDPLDPKPPHVHAAREVGDLLLHGGRTEPHRSLRSETGAREVCWPASTRVVPPRDARRHRLRHEQERADAVEADFKQHGQSGLWISDWLPHIAQHADDLAVIRSCQSDAVNHVGGVCQMNTGDILAGRPSLGAWVTYGLGSAKRNLPTFVVMQDDKEILGGVQNYGSGFLPATYSGNALPAGPHADSQPESAGRHHGRAGCAASSTS